MKLADLITYSGGHWDGRFRFYQIRGDYFIAAWSGPRGDGDDREGWWWAIVRPGDAPELVLGCGWTLGLRAVQRDADIAAAILSIALQPAQVLAS